VPALARQGLFLIAEGRFDHQCAHPRRLGLQGIHARPEGRLLPLRVSTEDPPRAITARRIADGGHAVTRGQHFQRDAGRHEDITHAQGLQLNHGSAGMRNAGEIGPDHVVEHVLAQGIERLRQSKHLQGRCATGTHGIEQQG